ncbi:MAG: hypothetical protein LBS29_03940, partial [Endomicrobium sp.]|nr:hypothetical protein [Endomicrobium sp.]
MITFAQTINITNTPNYNISGNSTITDSSNPECGRIDASSPWLSSNFNVSSNNSLVIHSTMSGYAIYGSVNFPFASSSVSDDQSNVPLKDSFICSSNSLTIYNDLNRSSLYGSFSLLSNAIIYITPSNNIINSTFSYTNNSINISSFSNISYIYGAYIRLDTKDDPSNPVTLTSSFYLDNNSINISSYCNVSYISAAYL